MTRILFLLPLFALSQQSYRFEIVTQPRQCANGSAALTVSGTDDDDVITTTWSNGQQNVNGIESEEGDYTVSVIINSTADTLTTDTTLNFTIKKELCEVIVENHFTPNGDGYNDFLEIAFAEKHPNFQFDVFNKWGQRVHTQHSAYVPWDGKSAGINVPDGTYYYIFFYDAGNKNRLAKGDISVLR